MICFHDEIWNKFSLWFADHIVITSFLLFPLDNSFRWAPGWLQGANRSGQSTPRGRFALSTACQSWSLIACGRTLLAHIENNFKPFAVGQTLHCSRRFSPITQSLTFPIYIPVPSLSFSINFKSSSCLSNILVLSALLDSLPGSEALLLYDFRPKHQVWMNHLLATSLWIHI